VAFVDEHRNKFGVESICDVLRQHDVGIAPSTYYAFKTRSPSRRAISDRAMMIEIGRVYDDNMVVYGADKIWDHLNNVDNITVARCTVERLMRQMGISGARRGKTWVKTTVTNDGDDRPADLVNRDFTADRPNQLWLADITYVKTHSGWVYVAFIIDVFSRLIVGWQASRSLRSDLAIDALEMAMFNRRRRGINLASLVHHSDRGVQYLSIRYSQRLGDNAIIASVGSVGDSYDNALIESFNGLYKWELIYRQGPWSGLDDVEFATLEYIDWYNHRRAHGEILEGPRYITPAQHETNHYIQTVTANQALT